LNFPKSRPIWSAIAHYCSWRTDGRNRILRKYEETISWIEWNLDGFPKKQGNVQLAILKQSYYIVYFIQERFRSLVLAVLDGRRDPRAIRKIVRSRGKPKP